MATFALFIFHWLCLSWDTTATKDTNWPKKQIRRNKWHARPLGSLRNVRVLMQSCSHWVIESHKSWVAFGLTILGDIWITLLNSIPVPPSSWTHHRESWTLWSIAVIFIKFLALINKHIFQYRMRVSVTRNLAVQIFFKDVHLILFTTTQIFH